MVNVSVVMVTEQQQKGRVPKKSKKNKRRNRPHSRELALAQAAQSLCGAYYKVGATHLSEGKQKNSGKVVLPP